MKEEVRDDFPVDDPEPSFSLFFLRGRVFGIELCKHQPSTMDTSHVVIDGKLLKRGEYISTWRPRVCSAGRAEGEIIILVAWINVCLCGL